LARGIRPLAVAASEAGEWAIALDLDPQQSLWKWGEERKAHAPAVDRLARLVRESFDGV
jgi:hypothetical protein